jgi:hypothetical protein
LRAYAFGSTVSIDEIKDALCMLDEMVDLPAIGRGGFSNASV